MNIVVPEFPKLNSMNRCDGCGHRAYVVVDMMFGDELRSFELCKHHYERHELALAPNALTVWDERGSIIERLDVSA
jgi:hypothetical protein